MAVFEVTDPRGYKVICTEENWKLHILDQYPFMVNYIDEIKQAIEEPFLGFIYSDATNEKRHIYYGKAVDIRYVKVVVEFDSEEGMVITAYLTTGMKKGEKLDMAHELKTLVKTSELKTNYIEKMAKQSAHSLYLNYNKVSDTLMLLFISPEIETLVHYVDDWVALLITPDTLDIVGIRIDDFKRLFLPKYDSVEKAWSLKESASDLAFDGDLGDLVIYMEKRKQKIAHEIFEATEPILGKPAQQLKDVFEFA